MNVKTLVKRLNELSAMSPLGDETEVVLTAGDWTGELFDRCCPELVEMVDVVDVSFIPREYFRVANNDDRDADTIKAIVIRRNSIA